MKCLLCHAESSVFARNALACPHCGLVYKDPAIHLSAEEESKRYAYHQNSGNDKGYIAFLSRLIDPLAHFLPDTFSALDFGCGPGPTMCYLLKERGGRVKNFDPLFFPEKSLLNEKYEVVTSTEVVEHFKTPQKDWEILAALVAPRGLLAVMTQFMSLDIDYENWWYKNDPTHVVFYQEKTFDFLAVKFGWEILFNDKKSVIIFRKK